MGRTRRRSAVDIFRAADTDGNGVLDKAEFSDLIKEIVAKHPQLREVRPQTPGPAK